MTTQMIINGRRMEGARKLEVIDPALEGLRNMCLRRRG
jgi:hypothetical protein